MKKEANKTTEEYGLILARDSILMSIKMVSEANTMGCIVCV